MKLVFCILLSASFTFTYGQSPETPQEKSDSLSVGTSSDSLKILPASERIQGIYATFEEFKQNKPSYTGYFEFDKRIYGKNTDTYGPGRSYYILKAPNEKNKMVPYKERFWGFCYRNVCFINHINRYKQITEMGRFCIFEEADPRNLPAFLMDYESGKIMTLTISNVRKYILANDPELLKEFEADKKKKVNLSYYVRQYNLRHP